MSGKEKTDLESGNKLFLSLQFLTEKADPETRIFPWSMPAKFYLKPETTLIYGTALVAGKTRKGDEFVCEELTRAARGLVGGPIEVFEHSWDVGESRWLPHPENVILDGEEAEKRLEYIARVSHSKVQQLIRDGTLNQVSVNAICRHVPRDDPGKCQGMILNGFCLLHKDSIPASEGTCVKVWNCDRMREGNEIGKGNEVGKPGDPKVKTEQLGTGPVAGEIQPSIEDRVKSLEATFESFQVRFNEIIANISGKLDTLVAVTQKMRSPSPAPSPAPITPPAEPPTQKTEAEWDAAYMNDLPDSAFAVIGSGGEKDDQGKTVPRTLRHLPHHNAEGGLDLPHLRAALARMNQVEPASLQPEGKKHLCAHAKESEIVSEFCGEEPKPKTEQDSCGCGEKKTAGNVVANFKPAEATAQEHAVVLTEQEILGVLSNKRLFTSALQLNGILDLLEKKKKEAD